MADGLEALANRFFATVGVVEPAGYRAIEVLLDESVQPDFGKHEHLLLAFTPEAAHEHARAELLTYGSPLLDVMTEVATRRGNAVHLYPDSRPTVGRTLEKVRAQARLPGHLVQAGEEQVLLFHHALFRFKVALITDEREEFLRDILVDLHTGWGTSHLDQLFLCLFSAPEPPDGRELRMRLSFEQACQAATEKLRVVMAAQVEAREDLLSAACAAEQRQVGEHYEAIIARLEAGKMRKGADQERIAAKVKATRADQKLRLEDLEKRYQLAIQVNLVQLALVSYQKATVPLGLQQGKEVRPGVAVWDSLVREGYYAPFS